MHHTRFEEIVKKRFSNPGNLQDRGQTNLARITGYSREHVSRWARGKKRIPNIVAMFLTMMDALDLDHAQVTEMMNGKVIVDDIQDEARNNS